ncbi:hypothetical protein [Bradyrhizobium sp.]|uniref:hypothetical protein n=1 Tax=Bradyrhizobium sp. TaxID=376 RepID=UPI003C3DD82E
MLRWTIAVLLTIAAGGAASAADQIANPRPKRHVSAKLPASVPRPRDDDRSALIERATPPAVQDDSDALISAPRTPLLPGSQTLPGNYGRAFDYSYQGAYYGGPYESYFFRLPYACGIYGYC